MKWSLFLVALWVSYALASDACQEVTKNQQKLTQSYPDNFQVSMEVIDSSLFVRNIDMYYSKTLSTIRLDILKAQKTTKMFFYFKDNEILTFPPPNIGRGVCSVNTELSDSVDDFLFGGVHGKAEIPLPMAVLHFTGSSGFGNDQIAQGLIGDSTTRGKATTKYTSCQKWISAKNNLIVKVTHQFAKSNVVFPFQMNQLLQMTISGTGTVNGKTGTTVNIVTNFYNFRTRFTNDKIFETPDGIVCPGRKIDMKPPTNLPPFIRYTSEVIDMTAKIYSQEEEIYDFGDKFEIHRQQAQTGSDQDYNRMVSIWDFNTLTFYRLDTKLKMCTASKNTSYNFNNPLMDRQRNGHIFMADPSQFFFTNVSNISYLGKKQIRGLYTDTWVADVGRTGALGGLVVQWNFAPHVHSWNDDNKDYNTNKYIVPMKYQMWLSPLSVNPFVQNIFHVDYNSPRPDYLDMSYCFKSNTHFQIIVKGSRQQIVDSELEIFKYKLSKEIANAVMLRWVHLNQMKVYYDKDDVYIEFLIGTNDGNMDKIRNTLTSQINAKKVQVYVYDKKAKTWSKTLVLEKIAWVDLDNVPDQANLQKQQQSKSGYKKGDMAGIGIGMGIVGVIGGVGAAIAHSKYLVG